MGIGNTKYPSDARGVSCSIGEPGTFRLVVCVLSESRLAGYAVPGTIRTSNTAKLANLINYQGAFGSIKEMGKYLDNLQSLIGRSLAHTSHTLCHYSQ